MDLEVIIFDEKLELVALSNHIALIVPAARNMIRSYKGEDVDGSSKL